ncbi:hypothetical protein OKW30_005469 [Paraburkholderia sp. Clong3]|uniref:hypothetical protein n=1 Tax=Paraburkholderia sp. Clong3 TaxID=2991061 RepID=UPI003D1DC11F
MTGLADRRNTKPAGPNASPLASIASSTFERDWVNVQRDPDDEQLMSALPPATWRTT